MNALSNSTSESSQPSIYLKYLWVFPFYAVVAVIGSIRRDAPLLDRLISQEIAALALYGLLVGFDSIRLWLRERR